MGGADVSQPKSVVGLDVHASQTHACVLTPETGELHRKRLNGPPAGALDHLERLPAPVLAVYEAGPTGYGLARGAAERGLDLRVCAPGSIPKAPSDRVKTDRRDAERLARLCLAGELLLRSRADPRRGALPRPRPSPRGDPRRPDEGPAPARPSSCCAANCAGRAPAPWWSGAHWRWLRLARVRRSAPPRLCSRST